MYPAQAKYLTFLLPRAQCSFVDVDKLSSSNGATLLSHSMNTTSLGEEAINTAGYNEFSSFSNSQLFKDFTIQNLDL